MLILGKVSWLLGEEWGREGSLPFDANDEDKLRLSRDVEGAVLFGNAGKTDLLTLGIAVLFDVGFGALEDDLALFFVGLLLRVSLRL